MNKLLLPLLLPDVYGHAIGDADLYGYAVGNADVYGHAVG